MANPIDSSTRDQPPCKGCTKRIPGCHDKCDKYAEWKCNLEKLNEERRKYNARAAIFSKIV
jgi:hypothetical protein